MNNGICLQSVVPHDLFRVRILFFSSLGRPCIPVVACERGSVEQAKKERKEGGAEVNKRLAMAPSTTRKREKWDR